MIKKYTRKDFVMRLTLRALVPSESDLGHKVKCYFEDYCVANFEYAELLKMCFLLLKYSISKLINKH